MSLDLAGDEKKIKEWSLFSPVFTKKTILFDQLVIVKIQISVALEVTMKLRVSDSPFTLKISSSESRQIISLFHKFYQTADASLFGTASLTQFDHKIYILLRASDDFLRHLSSVVNKMELELLDYAHNQTKHGQASPEVYETLVPFLVCQNILATKLVSPRVNWQALQFVGKEERKGQ